jgi:AraC-like DNA-binding protein
MYTFSIIDILLIVGLCQGILLISVLQLIKQKNKSANTVLTVLISFAILMLFGRVVIFKIYEPWIWKVALFADVVIFLTGPLYYLYLRRLLFKEDTTFSLKWYHFIPAALHFFATLYYETDLSKEYFNLNTQSKLFFKYLTVEILGLCSLTIYLFLSLLLLKTYRNIETSQVSTKSSVVKYVTSFTYLMALICLFWWGSFMYYYVFKMYSVVYSYNTMWICISLLIYFIGYYAIKQPEVLRLQTKKEKPDRLDDFTIKTLKKRIQFFVDEEHIYLNPDLTLKQFSEKLNASSNDFSWLLNNVFNLSFYEYINLLRINAFIKKVKNQEHKKVTLLALAFDVGFNSKSTFNRVFKLHHGCTPSQYIKGNLLLK